MSSIVLASQSPRRKQLLEWAEIEFDIMVSATDESYPAGLEPEEVALYIAAEKASAVKARVQDKIIIAADTIVVQDGDVMGKPVDREDALRILGRLSGNQHQVITGVVITNGNKEIRFADRTDVLFHPLTAEQIKFYVDRYQPYDKAGAYAIQEWIGVTGIKSISGDFYNVMGLPVSRVVRALAEFSPGKL
jgi:septum formation protein